MRVPNILMGENEPIGLYQQFDLFETFKLMQTLTCRSVKLRFLASSQRFCLETYALNKNSFSSSKVWNLEYGLRFLRTVT